MSTCERPGCTIAKNSNVNNNGGTHCCQACKRTEGQHGPLCPSKALAQANAEVAVPITGECQRSGCTLAKNKDVRNNGGTHCCNACKRLEGYHGPACISKKPDAA